MCGKMPLNSSIKINEVKRCLKLGREGECLVSKRRQRKVDIIAMVMLVLDHRAVMAVIGCVLRILMPGKLVHNILGQCAEEQQHAQANGSYNMFQLAIQNTDKLQK